MELYRKNKDNIKGNLKAEEKNSLAESTKNKKMKLTEIEQRFVHKDMNLKKLYISIEKEDAPFQKELIKLGKLYNSMIGVEIAAIEFANKIMPALIK